MPPSRFLLVVFNILPPFIVRPWVDSLPALSSIWPSFKNRDFDLFPKSSDHKICSLYTYKAQKVISENIKHDIYFNL